MCYRCAATVATALLTVTGHVGDLAVVCEVSTNKFEPKEELMTFFDLAPLLDAANLRRYKTSPLPGIESKQLTGNPVSHSQTVI